MKIAIDRVKFIDALNTVKDAVGTDAIQVIQNIKMETEGDDTLVLTATNLDIVVSTKTQCKITTPGATTVPAKLFVSMVNALTDPIVEFSSEKGNAKATLSSGEVTYRISTIDASEFPNASEVNGSKMSFKQSEFKDMIRKTSYAASQDSTRRSLMALCLQGSDTDGKVTSVCTDGRRLAVLAKAKDGVDKFEMLIPAIAVKFLNRKLDGDTDVDVTLAPGVAAIFSTDGWSLQTKLVADSYPNWKMVVPKDLQNHISVERTRFIDSIKQASISSSETNPHIVISFKDGTMALSAANEGMSDAKTLIPVKYSGDEIKVSVNPKYLIDILNSLDDDEVTINISNGTSPLSVTCANEGILDVVMPLRTT